LEVGKEGGWVEVEKVEGVEGLKALEVGGWRLERRER
jgi:hypothetical protein